MKLPKYPWVLRAVAMFVIYIGNPSNLLYAQSAFECQQECKKENISCLKDIPPHNPGGEISCKGQYDKCVFECKTPKVPSSAWKADPQYYCELNWGLWANGQCQCTIFHEYITPPISPYYGSCIPDVVSGSSQYEFQITLNSYPLSSENIRLRLRVARNENNWPQQDIRVLVNDVQSSSLEPTTAKALRDAILVTNTYAWISPLHSHTNNLNFDMDIDPVELVRNRRIVGSAGLTLGQGSSSRQFGGQFSVALTPLRNLWIPYDQKGTTESGWMVVGAGDFNEDKKVDMVWRRSNNTGEVRLWLSRPDGGWDDIGLSPPSDIGWKVVGVGDFNKDGRSDIAWRRTNDTGEVRLMLFTSDRTWNDTEIPEARNAGKGWMVVGLGDFNGDGILDLAWRRSNNTGEVRLWIFRTDRSWLDVELPTGDKGWQVVGVGDFNRDGRADLA